MKEQISVEKSGGDCGLNRVARMKGSGEDCCWSMEDWKPEVEFWIGHWYERNWLRIREWNIIIHNFKCEEMDGSLFKSTDAPTWVKTWSHRGPGMRRGGLILPESLISSFSSHFLGHWQVLCKMLYVFSSLMWCYSYF